MADTYAVLILQLMGASLMTSSFPTLSTLHDPHTDKAQEYRRPMEATVADLRAQIETAALGGPERAREKHLARGKLLPRQRVERLLDPGTPFLELSSLAAHGMYDDQAPAAGIITGIGRVSGRECVIVCNDATVKGGTYYPMTVKKHVRAQEIARENRLPCIYLVDSGGAFLPLWEDVFPDREHFGRIFYNQATLSGLGIPQIACVMGMCTAGGAYMPAMSDETVIVRKQGTIYLGGPPLVKAAIGVDVTEEELGGADVHARTSGVVDHYALDDAHALSIVRDIVASLQPEQALPPGMAGTRGAEVRPPGALRDRPARHPARPTTSTRSSPAWSTAAASTSSRPSTPPPSCAASPTSSASRSGSWPTTGSCSPSRRSRRRTSSSCATSARSRSSSCRTSPGSWSAPTWRRAASPRTAPRWSRPCPARSVPKFTVVIGGSFGAGNYAMCGRAYSPRFLWMWPNARLSVMGGEQAASVLATVKQGGFASKEEEEAFKQPIRDQYDRQGHPYYTTARLWDDGVIDPLDTRQTLALALSAAYNAPIDPADYGVFRM